MFSLALYATACSTSPPASLTPSTGHSKSAPPLTQTPTGFDNESKGTVDERTHAADQGKFEQIEAISDGLGPLFNAQSCRECHQSPVVGGASQVMELRLGHNGPDGKFQNPEIPINHGSEIVKGRSLVNQRAICPNAAFLPPRFRSAYPSRKRSARFAPP